MKNLEFKHEPHQVNSDFKHFKSQIKTWYSSSPISELIFQSSPSQGKRFPARFDLKMLIVTFVSTSKISASIKMEKVKKGEELVFDQQRVNSFISVSGRNESQTLKSVKLP